MRRILFGLIVAAAGFVSLSDAPALAQMSPSQIAAPAPSSASENILRILRGPQRLADNEPYCGQCTAHSDCGEGFRCCTLKKCTDPNLGRKGCVQVSTCSPGGN